MNLHIQGFFILRYYNKKAVYYFNKEIYFCVHAIHSSVISEFLNKIQNKRSDHIKISTVKIEES